MNEIVKFARRVSLRLATVGDAEFIAELRSDESKSRFLSQGDYSVDAQRIWIEEYKARELAGTEYYYVIQGKEMERFGVVRLYDFQGDSFCWGSWIIKSGAPSYIAIESALSVYEIAFNELGFRQAHFDVRKKNEKVVSFHKRFGAQETKEDSENWYFKISKENYKKTRDRYSKFLI